MDIERKGGNCIVINNKKATFVVDPKLSLYGLKDQGQHATAELVTQSQFAAPVDEEETVVIDGPGEYEVNNCSINGIAAQAHSQPEDAPMRATMYRMQFEDCTVAILGHIASKLSETQLEALGIVDILVIPVGGYGYSLEPKEAVEIIRAIEPKVVVPTHYSEEGVQYEVPQAPLDDFLKELAAKHEVIPKLKVKAGQLPETMTVYELNRTK